MPFECISEVNDLHDKLTEQQTNYLLKGELPSVKTYLQFEGIFNNQIVVWNACVCTMEEHARGHEVLDDPKQFIDIQVKGDMHLLRVGLNVSLIDHAMLERTIIMIRKYKRLHQGRHEYGLRSKTL